MAKVKVVKAPIRKTIPLHPDPPFSLSLIKNNLSTESEWSIMPADVAKRLFSVVVRAFNGDKEKLQKALEYFKE